MKCLIAQPVRLTARLRHKRMTTQLAPHDTADLLNEAQQLLELGLERYGRNQPEQAIDCWERVLSVDPGNHVALDYLQAAGWTGSDDSITTTTKAREPIERAAPSNWGAMLDEAMTLPGAVAAALVDYRDGATLGTRGTECGHDVALSASRNAKVVRAKLEVMREVGADAAVEDIVMTLDVEHHVIQLLEGTSLFVYLVLDKGTGNLGMARHRLAAIRSAFTA